jgi:hypothetical protein
MREYSLQCVGHFPYDGKKPTVMGINFGTSAFVFRKISSFEYNAQFLFQIF